MPVRINSTGRKPLIQFYERCGRVPIAEFDNYEDAFKWLCKYLDIRIEEVF